MKVAFMGSDPVALPLLEFLTAERPGGAELDCVFTQPDRGHGRGMRARPNAIKEWAGQREIAVRQPLRCGLPEADLLRAEGIDLLLVMAYGQILPPELLEAPSLDAVNLHASLLPRLRGPSPIQTAVALGLEETGVSLMRLVPKLDAGPVADAERVSIGEGTTTPELHKKLAEACPELLRRFLPALAAGSPVYKEQDPARVSYCRIIEKRDAHLDFRAPAQELERRIRAFQPWPGSSFPHGDQLIRIHEAEAEAGAPGAEPGTVTIPETGVPTIACGEGRLRVYRLQRPGGRPLPAAAFLRGYPLRGGTVLVSREMQPLEARTPFPYRKKRNSRTGKS
ncbi:MAG: methionyl-tRNA formyltransferase [Oceanipulchritudo sp.]